jgi:hypothetical protein
MSGSGSFAMTNSVNGWTVRQVQSERAARALPDGSGSAAANTAVAANADLPIATDGDERNRWNVCNGDSEWGRLYGRGSRDAKTANANNFVV